MDWPTIYDPYHSWHQLSFQATLVGVKFAVKIKIKDLLHKLLTSFYVRLMILYHGKLECNVKQTVNCKLCCAQTLNYFACENNLHW
jgi:hypothetical protein